MKAEPGVDSVVDALHVDAAGVAAQLVEPGVLALEHGCESVQSAVGARAQHVAVSSRGGSRGGALAVALGAGARVVAAFAARARARRMASYQPTCRTKKTNGAVRDTLGVAPGAEDVHPRSATSPRGGGGCVLALPVGYLHCEFPSTSLARHTSLPPVSHPISPPPLGCAPLTCCSLAISPPRTSYTAIMRFE